MHSVVARSATIGSMPAAADGTERDKLRVELNRAAGSFPFNHPSPLRGLYNMAVKREWECSRGAGAS